GFCLLRAGLGTTGHGAAERYLNAVFGFFVFGKNMLMSYGLITDDLARSVYEAQKGGHGFGDFSRIAEMTHLRLETVSAISLCLSALLLSAVLALLVLSRPRAASA